jgi:DNA repair protein RadC
MSHVRISEGSRITTCPHCGGDVPLTYDASEWIIRSPRDVFDRMGAVLGSLDREELHVLLLNTKNRILRDDTIYVGNVSASLVRVAELLRPAVIENASSIMLVHNHPSGDPAPSPEDLHLTAETLAAARLMDISLLDHIVIGRDSYVSLRERGVNFDAAR